MSDNMKKGKANADAAEEAVEKQGSDAKSAGEPAGAAVEGGSESSTAASIMADNLPAVSPIKGRKGRQIPLGIAHINATFNNTQVSITDTSGGVIAWSSSGKAGFKGSRKSTAFAATLVGQDAARQAMGRGMREVEVRVQGAGSGRESAIRALQSSGLNINVIKDVTAVPHNGCRPRKRRRV